MTRENWFRWPNRIRAATCSLWRRAAPFLSATRRQTLVDQQLNGGKFGKLTDADWELILPFLEENQKLFGITIAELLTVNGRRLKPSRVYRKVVPGSVKNIVVEDTDDVWAEEAEELNWP